MTKVFCVLVIGIFVMSGVLGLGISPARTTMDFEPGLEREIVFEVVNPSGEDVSFRLSAEGELARYISFPSPTISLLSSEGTKSFSYTISLPDELSPGLHEGELVVSEVPKEGDVDGSSVQATLAVATQIHVYVPFPGKYATAKVYTYDVDEEGFVRFVIPVISAGEFDLTSVRANVDIYNKLNEKVDSFKMDAISVPSGEKKGLEYDWKADFPIGEYLAKVVLIYDEGTLNLEHIFSVGIRELELQEINVNAFSLGEIVKLEMLVENRWSESIDGAHVRTRIKDDDGDVVSSFESSVQDIDALSKKVFVSYWDTAGVNVGDYETDVSIHYGNETVKKSLKFEVSEDNLVIVGLGYVISAEEVGGDSKLVFVLIVVIVVLVLGNLLWFLLLRKKMKKGSSKKG